MTTLFTFPISNGLAPISGPEMTRLPCESGTMEFDLSPVQQGANALIVQSVFVDNSSGATLLTLSIPTIPLELKIPAYSQATLPIYCAGVLRGSVTSGGASLYFSNVPQAYAIWSV